MDFKKTSSFSIILIFVCLLVVGFAFIPLLPVKLNPSKTLKQIYVNFSMPDNSSRIVEMEATSKLEAMLSRIKGVEEIGSTSGNGWGSIWIRFDKHVNIDAARFEISTIIRQTWPSLPKEVGYPSISSSQSGTNHPFLEYTINAIADPVVIQQFTENNIKTKLSQIEGVDRINVRGALPMEWSLEYDYKQLESLKVDIQDIREAIQNYLKKEFLGTTSIENKAGDKQWIRIALVPEGDEPGKFDTGKIEVKNIEGKIITLNELVTVSHVEEQARSYYRINGLNSIYMSIIAQEHANQLDLSRQIKEKLDAMKPSFPDGYEVHLSYDATEYIHNELNKIYFRTGLTLLILLLFVLLIYRSFKYLLLITITLTANISIAVIFFYLFRLEMQLYSLAGITISLTLIIDNTIVMSDQIMRRHNMKAFLAILTATITTIASLSVIFFMDEKIRLDLLDFACVIIINLTVSLFIALFLVPALLDKLKIGETKKVKKKPSGKLKRFNIYFNRFYGKVCYITWRWKAPVIMLIILIFGLPVFMLPDKIEGESKWNSLYNNSLGSAFYKEKVKPVADQVLGGTLRLFVQKVYEGSYFTNREETSLYVTATLPNGSTVEQMNTLVQQMEGYISQFEEIKQFQTTIDNAYRASIGIQFTKAGEQSGFPYTLKSKLISKALELGGGSWSVYGMGDGFSNDIRENAGSYQVQLFGYNYDELLHWTEKFKAKLLEHRRIKDVVVNSEFSWYKDDYQEYVFDVNKEKLVRSVIQPIELYASLNLMFGKNIYAGQVPGESGLEQIVLHSRQSKEYDTWSLQHIPGKIGEREYKLSGLAEIGKAQVPKNIVKINQQYRLCLQYEYIGAQEQGKKVLERNIEEFQKKLPFGYTIQNQERQWGWGKENKQQYWLLILVFVIIYFTCSILFNSLKQPLSVLFVIPVSFIGIFLAFYLFKLNFDQGGFASFILLCGLSVNANIYILNEYNNIREKNRRLTPLKAYIKAWNAKISPVFLTVISTILGFTPFLLGENKEAFWFPLAVGTIGGIIVSLLGTFCFLPLFMGVCKKMKV